MKALALAFILTLTTSVVANEPIRLSEPVASDETSETFGAELDASKETISLEAAIASNDVAVGETIKVETKINKVCQKKGCFFIAQAGDQVIRVSFQDYGFFIPTDSSGKTVTMMGKLVEKELSKEKAEHFNQDLRDQSTTFLAGKQYEFVATSVKIPRV
ncbi:DUF4920 domain-containing protein [Glaciecola sp. 1036]|uniref:DUF4920 domain-containing protein n=1 Tax=Alteromonadaceae TaxID=72275 RepID=UPI003D031D97